MSGFRSGWSKYTSGCFSCRNCGRKTRAVSGNESVSMCPQCDEYTMQENSISDGVYVGDPEGLANAEKRIAALKAQAVKRGGKIAN